MGRRIAALLVDWLIAYGLAALAMTVGCVTMSTLVHGRAGHLVRAGCGVGAAVRVHSRPVRARLMVVRSTTAFTSGSAVRWPAGS